MKGKGTIPIHTAAEDDLSHTPAKLTEIRDILREEYGKQHLQPWIVAYSGGKDSTLLLQLVYETVRDAPLEKRRQVYIVANDTQVESPLVIKHLKDSIEIIRCAIDKDDLPMAAKITRPYTDQTFWVNVIGRGYIPPTRNFRWYTDRLKIMPTTEFIEKLTYTNKNTILLVGTRKAESASRRRRMEGYERRGQRMNPHNQVPNCRIFSPLDELTGNEVWTILLQTRPPWGGTHRNLITLYKNAGGGECPLVLTKADAPSCGTTSPRFGCWTCTVVAKDRSLGGLIDSGYENLEELYAFRERLLELREDDDNRMPIRRNGTTKFRENGSKVCGPFTMKIRRTIRKELEALGERMGEEFLSPAEKYLIDDIWRVDQIQYDCHNALMRMSGLQAVG